MYSIKIVTDKFQNSTMSFVISVLSKFGPVSVFHKELIDIKINLKTFNIEFRTHCFPQTLLLHHLSYLCMMLILIILHEL